MSRTDRERHDHWIDRDYKDDRHRWQRRFRRVIRTSVTARDWDRADLRWRRTSGWLSH